MNRQISSLTIKSLSSNVQTKTFVVIPSAIFAMDEGVCLDQSGATLPLGERSATPQNQCPLGQLLQAGVTQMKADFLQALLWWMLFLLRKARVQWLNHPELCNYSKISCEVLVQLFWQDTKPGHETCSLIVKVYDFVIHWVNMKRIVMTAYPSFLSMLFLFGCGLYASSQIWPLPTCLWFTMYTRGVYCYLYILGVSCQKGPIYHASAWRVGPFWQDTLDMSMKFTQSFRELWDITSSEISPNYQQVQNNVGSLDILSIQTHKNS